MLETTGESIMDYIKIDETYIIIRNSLSLINYDENDEIMYGLNVNIAIASAITSYSRILMSSFKNNSNFTLYYSETDSLIIDR